MNIACGIARPAFVCPLSIGLLRHTWLKLAGVLGTAERSMRQAESPMPGISFRDRALETWLPEPQVWKHAAHIVEHMLRRRWLLRMGLVFALPGSSGSSPMVKHSSSMQTVVRRCRAESTAAWNLRWLLDRGCLSSLCPQHQTRHRITAVEFRFSRRMMRQWSRLAAA